MEREITLDDLSLMAQRAGVKLTDEELRRLLPGINRSSKQAAELRALITLETEPAAIFQATGPKQK
jgi:hypothetical protein